MEQTKPDITEFYRRVALPLMGLAEVIGTQGRSPGTVAQRSMQQFDTADEIRRRDTEAARKMAMEEALYGQKQEEYGREKVGREKSEANRMAFEKAYKGAGTPEEQNKALEEFLATENPLELAKFRLKKEAPDLYDMLRLSLLKGQKQIQEGQLKQQRNPRLSQNVVSTMTETANFPNLLNDLRQSISKNSDVMGPAMGRVQVVKGAFGLTDDATIRAQGLQQTYEAVKQVVAKAMEGGVLRKEDMPKYERILGSIKLTPEAAYQNISQLEKMLARDYNNKLRAYEAQGYDISGLEPIETSVPKPSAADFEE